MSGGSPETVRGGFQSSTVDFGKIGDISAHYLVGDVHRPSLANLLCSRMPWSDEFWKPIKLKNGRSVATLGEARVLILSLRASQQELPHWVEASDLLARASEFPSARDLALAAMLEALRADGLL
jgi:hypothetical protein